VTYLLDTNTVGYLIRGQETVLARLLSHPPVVIRISAITEGELRFGLANNPSATRLHKAVNEFLRRTTVLPWDREAALQCGALRAEMKQRGMALGPLDMLIAAHARSRKAVLVGSDAAFQRAPDLQVENWMIPT
jgi:tRNA(fMet)-specific endonuclease VapC